jgi:glycosyltransferase involved in cell wall biosynthesis
MARTILVKKENMKICIVTTSMPRYEDDNRSPFILDLALASQRQGKNISLVTMHSPGFPIEENIRGVPIWRLRYAKDSQERLDLTRAGIPAAWKSSRVTGIYLFKLLVKFTSYLITNGKKYDILHSNWTIAAFASILSKPFHNRPILVTLHGSEVYSSKKVLGLRVFTRWVLHHCNHVVCVSNALKEEVIALGLPETKVSVIPNGVNTLDYLPQNEPKNPIILFIGSLTEQKGVKYLLEAFADVNRCFQDSKLRIVGEGPELENLITLTQQLGIEENVTFDGVVAHSKVSTIMQESSIFVLPSENEGFGLVLLESLANGLPAIAFNSGGVRDILSEGAGILVEPGNVEQLANAIKNLITDKDLYAQIRKQGFQKSKNFSWEIVATKVSDIYESILEGNEKTN